MPDEQPGIVTEPIETPVQNILTEESAAAILDNKQLAPEAIVSAPIITPSTNPDSIFGTPEVKPPAVETKPPVSTEVKPPVSTAAPLPEPSYELDLGEKKFSVPADVYNYIHALHQQQEEDAAKLVALDEFTKDPYAFHAKYNSAIVIDNFKPEVFIEQKLKEKFGEHVFNPAQAYTIGSIDYQYRRAMEQFEKDAESYIATAQNATQEKASQANTVYEEAKTKVMTKFNLTPETYKSLVQDWLDENKQEDVLSLIVQTRLAAQNGTQYRANIEKAIERSNEVISPTAAIAGTGIPSVDDNTMKLAGIFGNSVLTANQP